jgi:DNA-binding NarL/FixJ family response regulator
MLITIVIADDHELVRRSYAALLRAEPDFKVIGECPNGRALVAFCQEARPDVALVDVMMPELNGIDAVAQLLSVSPMTRAIVLSNYIDATYVDRAIAAGAAGYISKSSTVADLTSAIREGRRGQPYLSEGVQGVINTDMRRAQAFGHALSAREREVLQLIAEGRTSKEVAKRLGISETTVKTHRNHIMDKLNRHHTAGLTLDAVRLGLVKPD